MKAFGALLGANAVHESPHTPGTWIFVVGEGAGRRVVRCPGELLERLTSEDRNRLASEIKPALGEYPLKGVRVKLGKGLAPLTWNRVLPGDIDLEW